HVSFTGACAIDWGTKSSQVHSLSTMESELLARNTGGVQAIHLSRLRDELKKLCPLTESTEDQVKPPVLLLDNAAAVAVCEKKDVHVSSLKHVDIKSK